MRRVWVCGGTSGIGKAIADRLSLCHMIVDVTGEGVDVREPGSIAAFVSGLRITDLVYSAGVNHLEWHQKIDDDYVKELFDINALGFLRVARALPDVKNMVVIGSDAAWRPMRTSAAYCASKAALHMMAQVVARERAHEYGFKCVVVAPGKVEGTLMTAYTDQVSQEIRPEMDHVRYQQGQIPSGRFCTPEDVAKVAADVLLSDVEYLNGAVIPVNGGRY